MTKEFEKKFWEEALKNPYAIVIGGTCFTFGSGTILKTGEHFGKDTGFRGLAGAKVKIEIIETTTAFDKGTIIETTNLWHQGDIPDWCDAKNNAIITDDSPTKLITKESRMKKST